MRVLLLVVAVGFLALARADELTDAEINDEMIDEYDQLPESLKDKVEERFAAATEDEPMDSDEDIERKDPRPGWGRVIRRVGRVGRRVVRRVARTGKRVVRRVARTGKRIVRRIIRFFTPGQCGATGSYRRGGHIAAGKASVSCILETDYRKQARCWAPKIYYAFGELYKASSVEYFLPHVVMKDNSNRVIQSHCNAYNLRAAQSGYLTSRQRLGSATSTLPFFRGQHPSHSPIYTFYRTFRRGRDVYRDFFYWAFFPYNKGKRVCLGIVIKGKCIGKCHWFGHHVGDWEHVTIRLKNNLPFAMYLSAHNFGGKYNYDNYRGTFIKGATAWHSAQRPHLSGNIALRRPTNQESTRHAGHASRAVDGNTNPYYFRRSCSFSYSGYRPWWRVDLGHQRYVTKVTITNRFDCCWNLLRNFEIRVGNINSADGANMLCTHFKGYFGRTTRSLHCSSPALGRYLYIRKLIPGVLTLCEVKVYAVLRGYSPLLTGNMAYRKGTAQISTGYNGHSGKAVDGNRNGNYNAGSCTHTHRHANPWWRVDLGCPQEVAKVSITNRADCCWGRLRRVEIRVGNHPSSLHGSSVCTYYPHAFSRGETKTLTCSSSVIGKYVYVRTLINDWLTLCEVQVYAFKPGNLARGKPTRQSSTAANGHSGRAVDGNRNGNYGSGSCTHTHGSHNSWWRVDLGSPQRVFKVSLSNRGDCCWGRLNRVEISVGNTDRTGANPRCHYYGSSIGRYKTVTFTCYRPLVGRYVYVRLLTHGALTLCEVEVYGTIGGQADLKMEDGHPVVFTAKGSHGMWTRQGVHTYKTLFNKEKLQDQAAAGLAWDTWRNMKLIRYQKDTKKHPYRGNLSWLNFNGSWGNKERSCLKVKFKIVIKKWSVNQKQCTLEGGPGSLNSRGAMVNQFPLN